MKISQISAFLIVVGILLAGCRTSVNESSIGTVPGETLSSGTRAKSAPAPVKDAATHLDGMSPIPDLVSASERGSPLAQALLGYLLVHGKRVPQDIERGMRLLLRSA